MTDLPIHHTFGPMADGRQIRTAFLLQFLPQKWKNGPEQALLKTALKHAYHRDAFLFDSGRGALLALLKAMRIAPDAEVIVQGCTCIAVPNAVLAAGAVPVFADIDVRTLNLNPEDVRRKITPQTKAVICQHTFGIPSDVQALRSICDEHGILLIEDCAHILDPTENSVIGSGNGAMICSFGRDKAVSGVSGGAVLTNDAKLSADIEAMEVAARDRSLWTILNLIDYPLRYAFAKAVWRTGLAKFYLLFLKTVGWLPRIYTPQEKLGRADEALYRMPNACAAIALEQWRRLPAINEHRRRIADALLLAADEYGWSYPDALHSSPAPQKFPLLVTDAQRVRASLKAKGIHLEDGWTGGAVNPPSVPPTCVNYASGSCSVAESMTDRLLTLPCHPTMSDAQTKLLIRELRSVL